MKTLTVTGLTLAMIGLALAQDDEMAQLVPELDGQPAFLAFGMIVVHPKGVEEPPDGYEGAMRGTTPMAIFTSEGAVAGEIYGGPLPGVPKEEADEMSRSADNSPMIELVNRASATRAKLDHEITTLRMKAPSRFGNPWILHSLYFPQDEGSVTFKFVAGEREFARLLPIFDAMLFTGEFMMPPPDAEEQGIQEPKVE